LQKLDEFRIEGRSIDEITEEEKFYEPVQLRSLPTQMHQKQWPVSEQNFSQYLTYFNQKFFVMPLGHPNRLIFSAPDLVAMKPNEVSF